MRIIEDALCILAYFLPQFIKDLLNIDLSLYTIAKERGYGTTIQSNDSTESNS